MTEPKVIWSPLPGSQQRMLSCPFHEVLLEGNRGGGKTDTLLMSFAQYVGCGFGDEWRGVIFRLTYPQLADLETKSLRWFKQIFPTAKYNRSEHFWRFEDGETLLFRYGSKEDDYWNYHGHAYPFLGFEELTNWADDGFYESMLSTCRSTVPGIPRIVRSTTNPYGIGHSWVKERFQIGVVPPETPFGDRGKERLYIHSSLMENTILTEADPDYLKTLQNLADPNRRAAWLDGSWDIAIGAFLEKVWKPKECIVEPFPIPSSWKVWKAMDWGYSKPYAVLWFAMSEDGIIYVWRELYGQDGDLPNVGAREDAKEVARKILEIEKHDHRYGYEYKMNLADPSIFTKIGTENSIGGIFRGAGVKWLPAWNARGSRRLGAQTIIQLLAEGRLKIFSSCKNILRTVPTLPPDDYDPEDVNTECEDHCFTADTLVLTNKGVRRIDSIGDAKVLNKDGKWVDWCHWRVIKKSAPTVVVSMEDGWSVRCTAEHLFLTSDGWVESQYLEGKEVMTWKLKSSASLLNDSTVLRTTDAANTFREKVSACIEKCGKALTEKFRKVFTSTIKTRTETTINCPTLNASSLQSISAITTKAKIIQQDWLLRSSAPKNGTDQTKGANGTKPTMNETKTNCTRFFTLFAKCAEKSSSQLVEESIAPKSARLAPSESVTRVMTVERAQNADVGCITVPDGESFCLANGVVVHNCWDALRYGVMRKRRAPNKDEVNELQVQSSAVLGSNSMTIDVAELQPDF